MDEIARVCVHSVGPTRKPGARPKQVHCACRRALIDIAPRASNHLGRISMMTTKLPTALLAVLLTAFALMLASPVSAQNADEIIALAKAQWAAENQNKPAAEAWGNVADDYTEFNAVAPSLIKGKALNAKFFDASLGSGDTGLVSEMLNQNVQFYGDIAILTYNYYGMTKDKDGKIKPNLAKSTRVYVKMNGKWMLVHANFAPLVPINN